MSSIGRRYVKGFKIDRQKVADTVDLPDPCDPEVDDYIRIIIHDLNRSGYKFIGAVHERNPPGQQPDGRTHLAVLIILDEGYDEEELRQRELGAVDDTIEVARPHVLVGPDVWELWG